MQCCMATFKDNLSKTEVQVSEISRTAKKNNIEVLLEVQG